MAAKKILMQVDDYVEDYETMVSFQALQRVGHAVHAVCPHKKPATRCVRRFTTSKAIRPVANSRAMILR